MRRLVGPAAAMLVGACVSLGGCGTLPLPPEVRLSAEERARVFARVVDAPGRDAEAARLEAGPYGLLLRHAAGSTRKALAREEAPDWTYAGLVAEPERFRGKVVTVDLGVLAEVAPAEPLPEALSVRALGEAARELVLERALLLGYVGGLERYELRIIRRAGSRPLRAGDIVRVAGLFLKNHAYENASGEVRRASLLVAPRPRVRARVEIERFFREVLDADYAASFPTRAPGPDAILERETPPAASPPLPATPLPSGER